MNIEHIDYYIPEDMQPVEELLTINNYDSPTIKIFKRLHKLNKVPIVKPNQELDQTIIKCLKKIENIVNLNDIDLIIYVHSLMPQVPFHYNLFDSIAKEFNLVKRNIIGISHLNCASFFGALEYSSKFFEKNKEAESILIITCDQSNFMPEVRFIDGATVMGDASTVTLIKRKGGTNKYLGSKIHIDTERYTGYDSSRDELKESNKKYIENLSYTVKKVVEEAGCTLDEIKLILPHNVNKVTWVNFCNENSFPLDKVFLDFIPEYGHLFCSDSQVNLGFAMKNKMLEPGDKYLLIGVGLGPIFGASLFEY